MSVYKIDLGSEMLQKPETKVVAPALCEGDKLEAAVYDIPSTGYCWRVMLRPDAIKVSSSHYRGFDNSGVLVGGGGQRVFLFLATSRVPLGAAIELRRFRPWMGPQDDDIKVVLVCGEE